MPPEDNAQPTEVEATEPATGDEANAEATEDTASEQGAEEESSADYWKRRAREADNRNKRLAKDLESTRRQSMSEQERAIAEAKDGARADVVREMSGRLVDAEVRSAAVNRPLNVDALLDGLDRSRFVDESGDVDREAVGAWLDQLAPVQTEPRRASDLGQGARGVNRSSPDDVFGQLISGNLK